MTDTVRLAKRVAELFQCSRNEATHYIEGGWVRVNGNPSEEPGLRVTMQDQITLLPDATLAPVEPVTILLNKPAGIAADNAVQLISPDNLAPDDRSGKRFLQRHLAQLSLLIPLETEASGLQVFSQDWRVIRKLRDDAHKIEHEYIVEVAGQIAPEGLALLDRVLTFQGKTLPQMKVSWQNETHLRFALKAAEPGLIPYLCSQLQLKALAIKRLRLGRLPLAGLKMGQWRYLLAHEKF